MGIGARLVFAFFTVILISVVGNASYSLFLDYRNSLQDAAHRTALCTKKFFDDLRSVEIANGNVAIATLTDPATMSAMAKRDKPAIAAALKALIDKTGLVGFITLVDSNGIAVYSTDTPAKSGYPARSLSKGIDYVFHRNDYIMTVAAYSPTDMITVSSMYPITVKNNPGVKGVVIVSQPLDSEFLTGLVTKYAIDKDHLAGVDLALFSARTKKLLEVTPNLTNPASSGPYMDELRKKGLDAIRKPIQEQLAKIFSLPVNGFEAGGRWWSLVNLVDADNSGYIGVMLITTPLPDLNSRLFAVVLLASSCGAVSLLFALLFTAGLTKGISEPLQFLIDRTKDLANQRNVLPPIEGLTGEWLELAESIDTAVSSMRTSVQSLKQQLARQHEEVQARSKHADDTGLQLEQLNRQFSHQAKQLSEVSKQINYANQQSVQLQHKLDAVLQISTEGFLILDQFGNILSANPVFLNWVGCSEGEIAGRLCFDLVKRPGEPRNNDREGKAFARHGGNPNELINQFYPEGVIYHRTQDKSVAVLAHLQPVVGQDGSIQAYIMVLRDKSLRSEIAQLRSEIVAMLSESIRVPLATAEQRWMYLMTNAAQIMPPGLGQPLAELHSHYEQLLGLVDSLLMMYGGVVPPSAAPRMNIVVTRLVAECLEQVAPLARERQLALDYKSVTGLPNITGNRDAAKDILLQTLEKMISVTSPGGRVRVESGARASEMRIVVSSSGPALPEAEIADMFTGFIEGKHPESSYGSRLGMYLVRNNIERLGGKIWAESEAGRGTAILFTLPMNS